MFDNNVFTFPMIFPVVPRDAARLRFFINAAHTRKQIDRTIGLLVELKAAAPASWGVI
jgi:8-amino-7-oxononanoate synthase